MNNKENILNKIQSLLNSQFFCVLATQAKEYPYCTLVAYAVSHNCQDIIFATSRNTHKYENLKKNPNLKNFVNESDCALIKVKVSKYILVNNFQNILEYSIKD